MGTPFRRRFCVVPVWGVVWWQRDQFVQQVSVQLLRLRQRDLQQEPLHQELLQLRTKSCHINRVSGLHWENKQTKRAHNRFINADLGAGLTGALCNMMNHLFPESNMKTFWAKLSPETQK